MPRRCVILADRAGRNGSRFLCTIKYLTLASKYKLSDVRELQQQVTGLFEYLDFLERSPPLPKGEAQNKIDNAERQNKKPDKRLHVFANQPDRKKKDPIKWNLVTGLARIWEQQTGQPASCYWVSLNPDDFSEEPKGCYKSEFFGFVKDVSALGGIRSPSGSLVCKILKETSKPTVSWLPEDYYRGV